MKKYSLFQAPYLSFFSRAFYHDVGKNWKGVAFGYLLLLLAVLWIPVMITAHMKLSDFITREAPKIVNQIPKITITNGEVSIDKPVPYSIIDPESGTEILLIDTSGQTTSVDQTEALALLTKDKLMIRQQHRSEIRVYDLSSVDAVTIDSDMARTIVESFRRWFAVFAYPFALAGSYAFRIVQALIYGLFGMLFATILKVTLDYPALLRLSVMAVTPVLIITTIATVFSLSLPMPWLLGFGIAMAYLFFGVRAQKVNAA
ncbi:MAG: hypothetical protein A2X56_06385 [Nitrospirae bacterium GWC2_57_13]|jgi:hypothetical protein|nr:MAG: hypothetical protein A2X56_06385 [Nitrospirae bacterium GWC2_57_13]HAS54427.1 hypothetical protein [Nitrospiraceae bacterium]